MCSASHIASLGQVAQSVEQGTENPRVGGSIPSLATRWMRLGAAALLVLLASGCQTDHCEQLCDVMRTRMNQCLGSWPVDWEELDARGATRFESQCSNRWAVVRADLEPRELTDALDQCEETIDALAELSVETGDVLCDDLRALYVD